MGKWMDLAAKLEAETGTGDKRDDRDESSPHLPIVPNVPNVPASLPQDVQAGLAALRVMAAPRITKPEIWLAVVADALRLASDGRAKQALALGWHPLELWGCSPVRGGNPDHDGLAVWIDGRRVVLLNADCCMVETAPGSHSFFNRRQAAGAVFLWDIGREVRNG